MSFFDSSPVVPNEQEKPVVFGEPGPETDWFRGFISAQNEVIGACRQCHVGKRAKGLEICHACANGAIKAIYAQSDIPAEEDTPTFEGWVPTAEDIEVDNWIDMTEKKIKETAAALAALAPHLSPDRVAVASDGQSVRGARSWAAEWAEGAELADRQRLRAVRASGECQRACGNVPKLPVCTKCFVNLHAGKYKGNEKTGDFTFGYGDNWYEMLTVCSQVHGWIKPSGVAA